MHGGVRFERVSLEQKMKEDLVIVELRSINLATSLCQLLQSDLPLLELPHSTFGR